jgi:pimeloyl-ACP methyl ester carboxylesterase
MTNILTIAGINLMPDIFSGLQEFLDESQYCVHRTPLDDVCHDEQHWRHTLDTDAPWIIIDQGAGALLAVELAQISGNVAGVLTLSMDVTGHSAIYRPALRFLSRLRTSLPSPYPTSAVLQPAEIAHYYKSSHISITTLLAFNQRSNMALDDLRSLWIPVMNVYGAQDLPSVVQSGQLLRDAGYASVAVEDSGHMGLVENPQGYAIVIQHFLDHVSDINGNVTEVPSLFFKMLES